MPIFLARSCKARATSAIAASASAPKAILATGVKAAFACLAQSLAHWLNNALFSADSAAAVFNTESIHLAV